ncbi:MAG: Bax inhibitor-1/YccA family protein [Vulcanimicrobiota bacterium]
MALRTGNPTLKEATFAQFRGGVHSSAETMTLNGTVHRTFFLLCLVVFSASTVWSMWETHPHLLYPALIGSSLLGFITAMVTVFKQQWSPYTASIYALLEGVVVGVISSIAELNFPGIVMQAVGLTFGTLFCLLAAYRSGLIKPTENFKLGVVAATGGIALLYLVSMVSSLVFSAPIPMIHESGPIGIGFSLFVVVIAALNLVLDFDFIEQGVEYGAPKYMEWYAAFGLVVTLIWLYLEILRLLMKIRSND